MNCKFEKNVIGCLNSSDIQNYTYNELLLSLLMQGRIFSHVPNQQGPISAIVYPTLTILTLNRQKEKKRISSFTHIRTFDIHTQCFYHLKNWE